MGVNLDGKLVVAISSRALFNFEEEHQAFMEQGSDSYTRLQLERLESEASPGVALPLVRKLLAFNTPGHHRVEIVILSRNDPASGLRVFRNAEKNGLTIERGVFTRGRGPWPYLEPLKANLFLSADQDDVQAALARGFPAARVYPLAAQASDRHQDEIRIAFDGDAVLFSDESEQVYQRDGLDAFQSHELEKRLEPIGPGPFKPFLQALHRLQSLGGDVPMRIRTALVTARSAPAHERAIRTLMAWGVEVDEAMFLGGLEKGPFLKAFEPDFFFDDHTGHCESAALAGPTGHVASGVRNP